MRSVWGTAVLYRYGVSILDGTFMPDGATIFLPELERAAEAALIHPAITARR